MKTRADFINTVAKRLEPLGHTVLMNTKECVMFQLEHNNKCTGCTSEVGCKKVFFIETIMENLFSHEWANPLEMVYVTLEARSIANKIITAPDMLSLNQVLEELAK